MKKNSTIKVKALAIRNAKELLRDPVSYIFALGFPVAMLIIMTIVNESIPKEAGLEIFQINNLAPGIVVFGLTFIMQFTTILLSKDRSGSFLNRMYCAPMGPSEFLEGYTVPVFVLAVAQIIVTYIGAEVVSLIATGQLVSLGGALASIVFLIPTIILFISLGLVFGGLFSEKAAPGVSSILITVAGILGGIWMDVKSIGGVILTCSQVLPFYPATYVTRSCINGTIGQDDFWMNLAITVIYALVAFILGCMIFKKNMKKEK